MLNLFPGEQYRVGGNIDIRILATAGTTVQLGIASSHESTLCKGKPCAGYYMFSGGKRWFVAWIRVGDQLLIDNLHRLRPIDIHGDLVAVDIGS